MAASAATSRRDRRDRIIDSVGTRAAARPSAITAPSLSRAAPGRLAPWLVYSSSKTCFGAVAAKLDAAYSDKDTLVICLLKLALGGLHIQANATRPHDGCPERTRQSMPAVADILISADAASFIHLQRRAECGVTRARSAVRAFDELQHRRAATYPDFPRSASTNNSGRGKNAAFICVRSMQQMRKGVYGRTTAAQARLATGGNVDGRK